MAVKIEAYLKIDHEGLAQAWVEKDNIRGYKNEECLN